jgi:hypothetical protein
MKALLSCLMVLATAGVAGLPAAKQLDAVYFADALGPGRIYGLEKGTAGTYYARVKGAAATARRPASTGSCTTSRNVCIPRRTGRFPGSSSRGRTACSTRTFASGSTG